MSRQRTPAMQEHYDRAYRDVTEGGGTSFAYGYLYKACTSGQYAAPALHHIAEGVQAALRSKGYC
jgi:hypothetical protein